jgi:2'-5' RNA ligase
MIEGCKGDPINCFALVAYIPDPLGAYLDRLRAQVVPDSISHAHVTVLPPRPLFVETEAAATEIHSKISQIRPFEVEATQIEIFPVTSVIYVAIGDGRLELVRMHDALNDGAFAFHEPFSYHPHITLAQEILPPHVPESFEKARRLWAEFSGHRRFTVNSLTLVQSVTNNHWLDLAECKLAK